MTAQTSRFLGRYELIARLAAGGMAEIWLARQRSFGGFRKVVALKRIRPKLASKPHFIEMFAREARLAAQLSHANIAQIYDLDHVDGHYLIAMEFVHGETLGAIQRRAWELRGRPVAPELVATVLAQVCRALHHAHTATDLAGQPLGMIDRDVSPTNVLVGYRGAVKVVDFGIARAHSEVTAGLDGKAGYMSPEQCAGHELDARSDVFGAGILLWEMLTGVRLFGGMDEAATRDAIMAPASVRSPTDVQPWIVPDLADVALCALSKDAAARFASAAEMADALEGWLVSERHRVGTDALGALVEGLFRDRLERWQRLLSRAGAESDQADEATDGASPDLLNEDVFAAVDSETDPRWFASRESDDLASATMLDPRPPELAAEHAAQASGTLLETPSAAEAPPSPRPPGPTPTLTYASRPPPPVPMAPPIPLTPVAPPEAKPAPPAVAAAVPPAAAASPPPPQALEAAEPPAPAAPHQRPESTDPALPARTLPTPTPAVRPVALSFDDGYQPDPFADDQEEEDEDFRPLASLDEAIAAAPVAADAVRPSPHRALGLEILELTPNGSRAIRSRRLARRAERVLARVPVADGAFHISLHEHDAQLELGPDVTLRGAEGPPTGRLALGFGEAIDLTHGERRYRLRLFIPPTRPKRGVGEILWGVYAAAILIVIAIHAATGPAVDGIAAAFDLDLTIDKAEDAEVFADVRTIERKKLEPPPRPKAKPKPKPKKVEAKPTRLAKVSVAEAVEARPQIPKSARRKVRTASQQSDAAKRLVERLQAPKQGAAQQLEDIKTNINAKAAGRKTDAHRVTGMLAGLKDAAPSYATAGGAKETGPLSGEADTKKITKRLDLGPKKANGKVRGKVTAMRSGRKVKGQLEPSEVYRVIDKSIGKIQRCYEQRLRVKPSLAGKVTFRWTITESGGVAGVKQHTSSLGDGKVSSCISAVLKRLRFPKPKGGSVEVSYPFIFRST